MSENDELLIEKEKKIEALNKIIKEKDEIIKEQRKTIWKNEYNDKKKDEMISRMIHAMYDIGLDNVDVMRCTGLIKVQIQAYLDMKENNELNIL